MDKQRLLAFEVTVDGFDTIVFAASASKAKWLAVSGYWESYGKREGWPELKCARGPLYDGNALATHRPACYAPGFVRSYP